MCVCVCVFNEPLRVCVQVIGGICVQEELCVFRQSYVYVFKCSRVCVQV